MDHLIRKHGLARAWCWALAQKWKMACVGARASAMSSHARDLSLELGSDVAWSRPKELLWRSARCHVTGNLNRQARDLLWRVAVYTCHCHQKPQLSPG